MKTDVNNTEVEKPKTKKKGKRIFLRILAILLCIIVAFVGITTVISVVGLKSNANKAKSFPSAGSQELKLDNYSNGCWNIYSDTGLKVMQLTDVHLGGGWMSIQKDSMALNAVATMVKAEKPDLVIVTGDIAFPVPFMSGTFNNKSGAKLFAQLMESLGVYWTVAFGNHDTEAYSYYTREEITDFYSSGNYPHCLLQSGPQDVDGSGNQIFNVVNSDGIITRSLFVVDSHSYIDGDVFGIQWKYDNIHDNQISWYKNSIADLSNQNKNAVASMSDTKKAEYEDLSSIIPTSVFLHIPLTEYKDAWNGYVANGYKDSADIKFNYGVNGESGSAICCPIHDDSFFETMVDVGSTDSVFCGHDHLNTFSINYKDIDLNYSMSIDYLAYKGIYKLGSQRGCTIINIGKDGTMTHELQNYYQDKYTSKYTKESVTMQ